MSFSGIDYFDIEQMLSAEEILVRDTVRQWVDERLMPIIGRCFDDGKFPLQVVGELAERGLLGAALPADYGCANIGEVAYGLAMQELERCDSGIRSFVSVQNALCMYPIFRYGSEQQRQRWLPQMAAGKLIGCFGLTEADGGSDPAAMRTNAKRVEGGYRLNGAKMWITNGSIADIAIVWAMTHETDGTQQVRGFVVERDFEGFSAPEIANKLSLRASVTSELVFDDVFVPDTNVLSKATGLRAALSCLTQARYSIAWGAVGAAMACYDEARSFAVERKTFGGSLATKQLVQHKLVDMAADITKCQLLCWRLGRLKEDDNAKHQQVSLAKRECVAMALHTARLSRDLLGASGITGDYQSMRHLCNLESVSTYEGTHDIQTLIIGADLTGHRAF